MYFVGKMTQGLGVQRANCGGRRPSAHTLGRTLARGYGSPLGLHACCLLYPTTSPCPRGPGARLAGPFTLVRLFFGRGVGEG